MMTILQLWFRLLSKRFPGISGRLAARLFMTPGRHGLQSEVGKSLLEVAERRSLQADGSNFIEYRWRNDGPRVLLVHGWSDRAANLGELVQRMLEAGFDVTVPDLPAHGDAGSGTTNMREWLKAIRRISAEAGRWHAVLGHSLGGFAVAHSLRRDLNQYGKRVLTDNVVLIAPPASSLKMLEIFSEVLEVPRNIRSRAINVLSKVINADFVNFSTGRALAQFDGAAMVIHDTEDRRVPFSHFEVIRRLAPMHRYVETVGLGHRRILFDDEVLSKVEDFLALPELRRQLSA